MASINNKDGCDCSQEDSGFMSWSSAHSHEEDTIYKTVRSWYDWDGNTRATLEDEPAWQRNKGFIFPWEQSATDVDFDFMDFVPQSLKRQAKASGLIMEASNDKSFLTREWVTGWKTCNEDFDSKLFKYRRMGFVVTEPEAKVLLRVEEAFGSSLLTAVRLAVKMDVHEGKEGKIVLDRSVPFNPWYRYGFIEGTGRSVQKSVGCIYRVLQDYYYNFMTPAERLRAIPWRAPLHPKGVRPMIITLHCDPEVPAVAVNPGYCYRCLQMNHVRGDGRCKL